MMEIMYDPDSLCPRMTIQRAIDLGLLPPDIFDGLKALEATGQLPAFRIGKYCTSFEALQDVAKQRKELFAIRTPPITEKEVADWHKADAQLNLDAETIDQKRERLLKLGFKF